jgi:hypothetical protein
VSRQFPRSDRTRKRVGLWPDDFNHVTAWKDNRSNQFFDKINNFLWSVEMHPKTTLTSKSSLTCYTRNQAVLQYHTPLNNCQYMLSPSGSSWGQWRALVKGQLLDVTACLTVCKYHISDGNYRSGDQFPVRHSDLETCKVAYDGDSSRI